MRGMIVLGCGVALCASASGQVYSTYDLASDWTGVNPFGLWNLSIDTDGALPAVANWSPEAPLAFAAAPAPQPGHVPVFFLSTPEFEALAGIDAPVGSVIHHTAPAPGTLAGTPTEVLFLAPEAGIVNVTGSIWLVANRGRHADWGLWVNDVQITSGRVFDVDAGVLGDDDPWDSSNPLSIDQGNPSLENLVLDAGDKIELRMSSEAGFGSSSGSA